MKVLVVNGSPKGPKSNTMQMTNAVLKGLKETNPEAEIELLTVKDMDIKPCMGCMSCWGKTAGQCVINDVMQDVHELDMNILHNVIDNTLTLCRMFMSSS